MNLRTRPARVAAAVGAVVVAGTTTFVALTAGTASADEPGRCTQNVNVREEPDENAKIVKVCEAGTKVQLGAERDGWVELEEQGGWASKEFVKADESSSGERSSSSSSDGEGSSSDDRDSARSTHTESGRTDSRDAEDAHDDATYGPGAIRGLLN
jgi:uncharacterized protein YraI